MGYYVTAEGKITIPADKEQAALQALHDLNWRNDLKSGGTWPATRGNERGPRPDKWFSWLAWDYHLHTPNVRSVLEHLGFHTSEHGDTIYLHYDNKTGDEEVFLQALAPYVTNGEIRFQGEDGRLWRLVFENGVLLFETGTIVYSGSSEM